MITSFGQQNSLKPGGNRNDSDTTQSVVTLAAATVFEKDWRKHSYLTKAKNVYNSISSRHLLYVLSIPFRDGVFHMCSILAITWAWTKIIFCLSFSEKLEAKKVQKREKEIILTLKYDNNTHRSPWYQVEGEGVLKLSGYHFPAMFLLF